MPDQGDRNEFGTADETASRAEQPRSNVTPVVFGDPDRRTERFEGLEMADPDDFADDEGAVDISLVHADDAFLDSLGAALRDERTTPAQDFRDDELALLLTSWRDEVDAAPMGELVDTQLAQATVLQARTRKRHRRPRLLVPFAAAAAVLAIAFTGAGLAARDAHPGDTLWSLTKVLYADHARSVEAAASVRADLEIAQAALNQGNVAEAKGKLEEAKQELPSVSNEDGRTDLAAQHADLLSLLRGNPADPATPPPLPNPSTAAPVVTTPPATSHPPKPTTVTQPSNPPSSTTPPLPSTTPEDPPVSTTVPTATGEVPREEPEDTPSDTGTQGEATPNDAEA
ncbi:hypothetical protein UO65_1522 [Actinokineospora spheciospongiae]|uniref:Anti-sigma-D factor RsdA sigma factor binding region domain-containing protein n=1 Tax=Actinokineospora spheciospongiae TaxID=909613 RepID=W7J2J4_9PSEU|nr:anti-sigma-D factor RsdA [Actinokineospora spheciospongiae]EWC63156.1 hypothetical protein UO65_1522 [Actinokineospora spheciospongiae]